MIPWQTYASERVLLSLNTKSGDIRWIKFYKNEGFGAIEGVKEVEDGNIIMTSYVNGTSENGFLSMESDGINENRFSR